MTPWNLYLERFEYKTNALPPKHACTLTLNVPFQYLSCGIKNISPLKKSFALPSTQFKCSVQTELY